MAVSYTTTNLVQRIRRTTQLSDDNLKLNDAEILQIADESIQSRLWPTLRATIEEYATTHGYVTFDSASPVGSSMQRLPSRASGSTIVAVYQVLSGGQVRVVPRFDITEAQRFGDIVFGDQRTGPRPGAYALTGDYIKIIPAASEDVTLRVLYERRPSRLCAVSEAAEIESWNSGTNIFTVDAVPDAMVDGVAVDLVKAGQQATDPLVDNAEIEDVPSATTIELNFGDTLTGGQVVYASLSVGDFICEAGTTCVFPLPDNWYSVCVMSAAADALMQAGYMDESLALMPAVERMVGQAANHAASRVRKQPKAMFDRDSPLRTGSWYGRGWNNGGSLP